VFSALPLLLTLMASLHAWRGGSLPEKREELYNDTVDLLLDWWERPKTVREASGQTRIEQPSLAEWLKVDRQKVRELLNALAFAAHRNQPELAGTADVPEEKLIAGLMRLNNNQDVKPGLLIKYLSERAGLLLPRGVEVYTFPHRTFQEYLAACYLADHDFPDQLADLVKADPNRWREVALLAGAKASRGTASAVWNLVEALCYREVTPSCALPKIWGAHWAGQALVEIADLNQISERNRDKKARVQQGLLQILRRTDFPAIERALAGNALAHLGDPRFRSDAFFLLNEPLLGFVEISAGKFLMGSDKKKDSQAFDRELEQHSIDLPMYYLARYPVTVAQFQAFVNMIGYKSTDPRSLQGLPNHPMVYVTWYEACAYCEWLTEQLRAWKLTPEPLASLLTGQGWKIMLPSEAEWEKAARSADGRIYPWGNNADPNRANYRDTGIGATNAVGCFPGGTSPYGCEEMSGNVWEWTRSLWGKNWEKPDFKCPYKLDDGREQLDAPDDVLRVSRGGSFYHSDRTARCARRYGGSPFKRYDDCGFRLSAARPLL
jgi:formylglycine-generating enzyme required for sulfatase activity